MKHVAYAILRAASSLLTTPGYQQIEIVSRRVSTRHAKVRTPRRSVIVIALLSLVLTAAADDPHIRATGTIRAVRVATIQVPSIRGPS
jgi:hypothetical protein